MANINEVYGSSELLKASDILGKKVPVTIEKVDRKEFDDGAKLILRFHNKDKGLVLNKTNANRIAELHGPDWEQWINKDIALVTAKVEFSGKIVDAIRVFVPEVTATEEEAVPF